MSISVSLSDDLFPATFIPERPLSDADFQQFCFRNDQVQIERTAEGAIRLYPMNCAGTSAANSVIGGELREWWHKHKTGRTVGSASGFFLPDGSMLCPDAAYISEERMATLDPREWAGIPHVCPDFVIELLANWESREAVEWKITRWVANGVRLAWLIDPYRRLVGVYAPSTATMQISESVIRGTAPVGGFALDLDEVWRSYEVSTAER